MTIDIVVADDLTGVADTLVQFAARDVQTIVFPSLRSFEQVARPGGFATGHLAIGVSTESRHLTPSEAARRVARAHKAALRLAPRLLFQKVDSALRGNPGAEVSAYRTVTGEERVLLAPSFLPSRRTVRDGILLVHGVPLAQSNVGRDLRTPMTDSSVCGVLSRQTETAASVLPRGSGSVALALPGIVVADAETAAELAAVARRVVDGGLLHAVSGSAGLAGELSRILIRGSRTANAAVRSTRTLVFFGSPHPVAVEQLETARLHFGLTVHRPTVSRRSIRISSAVEEAEFDLLNGGLALVGAPLPDERVSLSPASVALGLARTALRVMDRTAVDAIVVSGGDIAAAICAALGVERIVLTGQFYPGAPLGRIQGGAANGAWLVTKSGAHGDARGLVTILSALRGPPGGELPCDSVEKETSVL